jgi:hypothetical protein
MAKVYFVRVENELYPVDNWRGSTRPNRPSGTYSEQTGYCPCCDTPVTLVISDEHKVTSHIRVRKGTKHARGCSATTGPELLNLKLHIATQLRGSQPGDTLHISMQCQRKASGQLPCERRVAAEALQSIKPSTVEVEFNHKKAKPHIVVQSFSGTPFAIIVVKNGGLTPAMAKTLANSNLDYAIVKAAPWMYSGSTKWEPTQPLPVALTSLTMKCLECSAPRTPAPPTTCGHDQRQRWVPPQTTITELPKRNHPKDATNAMVDEVLNREFPKNQFQNSNPSRTIQSLSFALRSSELLRFRSNGSYFIDGGEPQAIEIEIRTGTTDDGRNAISIHSHHLGRRETLQQMVPIEPEKAEAFVRKVVKRHVGKRPNQIVALSQFVWRTL